MTVDTRVDLSNKFRNIQGTRRYGSLFYEKCLADKSTAVFTLKDHDYKGYPSLYRLYMESEDPTEYEFAINNLDGWEHWEILCQAEWFQPFVSRWRRELEVKIRSRALANIVLEAADPKSRNTYNANKMLLEKGWLDRNTKGRPTKDDISKAAKDLAEEDSSIAEAFKLLEGASGDDRGPKSVN